LNNLLKDSFLDIGEGDLLLDPGVVDHSLDENGLGSDIDIDFDLFSLTSDEFDFRHFVFLHLFEIIL
jgi:hypothetical protein